MRIHDLFDEWDKWEEAEQDILFDFPQREEPEVSTDAIRRQVHAKLEQDPAERRRHMHQIIKKGICATVAAASLITGAFATVVYNKRASESFAGLFGTAHSEIIDKIGHPVGVSDTVDEVTITAEAVIGDAAHYAILYRIAHDDGTPFDLDVAFPNSSGGSHLPLYFSNDDTFLDNFPGVEQSYSYFYDEDPADNAIGYVMIHELRSGEQPQRVAEVELEDLMRFDADGNGIPVASGKWKLSFDLDFEDASIALPAGQTFRRDGFDFTIQQVTLSPIALRVDYTAASPLDGQLNSQPSSQAKNETQSSSGYLESVPLIVKKIDGTTVDLSHAGGKVQSQNGQATCQKGDIFGEVLPLEEVVSVTVGDVEIPVEVE